MQIAEKKTNGNNEHDHLFILLSTMGPLFIQFQKCAKIIGKREWSLKLFCNGQ